ncbi:ABC transporter permease [Roseovarius sp. TE539]|uniref:ABC transporter permease n=1 Tax=Roseovarius sp. TE539 TaxID=2249812 RepID=UPI000DE0046C|nr:ABC transporter permease [Roseovarius sp. TE539]RBI70117.1 ABC transporter permease [Roseovarius sp. TE539]
MTRACLQALFSHWWRNPLQLFTLLAGLGLATALWSGVQAVNSEARSSYDAAAATLGEARFDQLVPRAGDTIPQQTFVALRRAGWKVAPVLSGTMTANGIRVRIVGIDPLTAPGGIGPQALETGTDPAAFLSQPVLFANPEVADPLAGAVPDRVVPDKGVAPGTALTDIGVAQRLLERPGELSRLIIVPRQPMGRPPLDRIAPDLLRRPAQGGSDVRRLTDSFHLNLSAFGLLSFAVGIFIVHGAIGLAFEQRRAMVRTLRALGMPLRRLVILMAAELLMLALVAGAIGVLLGYAVAAALLPDVAATLEGLYGAQVSGALQLRPAWWLSGLGIAMAGTVLAGAGALWRIARMPILHSAGARAWSMTSRRWRRVQAVAAVALFLAAGILARHGDGLVPGFGLLACLLLGAALALPLLLDPLLDVGMRRTRGVVSEWFWADTRQQLPGLSLSLMALLLAMAANVGVSTMVSSFRLTFEGFLDQRLASELYVTAEDKAQAEELQAFVASRVRAVLPLLSVETRLAGVAADLYGARVGPTYSENWKFLDSRKPVWPHVAAGEAVIVNEQLARRAGLTIGEHLDVGQGVRLPIAGIVGDYGNPVGQAVIGEALFRKLFPEIRATRFGLRSNDPEALRAALIRELGLPPGAIVDQARIKAFSMRVFERTFTVTAALNVLTLAVAGFAMLMSLLTLAGMRVPQLAPAWALGLTRRTLGRLELLRAMLLAALTMAMALPLGLALAWVLLAIVNVEAFGWRLPMYLFPSDYAVLGVCALAAATLAAAWPAWRLSRTPPSDLLKVFSNER